MGKYRTRELTQRVRYALLAGVAGAFLIPQVAAAAPTGEHDYTAGVTVGRAATAAGTDTNITATAPNNVIKWADYSVKQGEKVEYDGKNYLNIVTGGNTSAINGTIKNTGGDIYLVNPNGVIFGKTASVNVGNLYVSTQEESTLNMTAFTGSGASPLSTTVTDVGKADVVNMGSITANKVEVYGRSIRILDAAKVHDATTSPVVLHTDTAANGGYAHVGYKSGAEPAATAYKVNGANAVAADNYYQLVSTPTQFQNINNDLTKNYMLANDIDFYDAVAGTKKSLTPIGGDTHAAFSGKFDGNFFRIQNFTVSGTSRAGAFGEINGARIDNVGITGATITGGTTSADYAGGVVGYATSSTLKNVYSDRGTTVSGANGRHGGIVGYTTDTKVDSVYSKATIGAGGGIIGLAATNTKVYDAYSDITATGTTPSGVPLGAYFIYYINPIAGTEVHRAYFVGGRFSYSNISPDIHDTFKITEDADHTYKATLLRPTGATTSSSDTKAAHESDTYAAWGNTINNTGAPGAKWRIYEGRTLPLLTAFMDGTATATYDTRYFNANGTLNTDPANTAKSNEGADIETTYNSQYVKIVGKNASGDAVVGGKSNVVTYAGAMQYNADGKPNLDHIYDYVSAGTNDFDKTNGIRNAGTKAILWSDQDGPNLRGVNVTVKQREVKLDGGSIKPERMYNGKSDVTDAFIQALSSGNIKSSGFTAEDVASGSVRLDFTTGNFKAVMVKNKTLPATGANLDKNVGTDKPVKFSGSIGFSGDDAANYHFDNTSLSSVEGKATITKAPLYLKINKTRADAKIYDGTDAVLDLAMKQSGTTTPNITLNKDNYAPASTVTSPTHHKGEIMLDDGDNPDDVDLTQVTDPTYTDTTGAKQIHVGDHNLQYKNVGLRGADAGNYDLYLPPIPAVGNGNKVVGNTVYLDGKIIAREITRDSFKVYNRVTGLEVSAEKVYDGNVFYTPDPNTYLSVNAPASSTTGIVARDHGHITFALTGGRGRFQDGSGNDTKNVAEATKLAYNVTGVTDTHTDAYGGHELSDYYVLGTDGVTKHSLSSAFDATGDGKITPKVLTATVVNSNITKVYDAMREQTDGNRHIIKGDPLVTLSGFVTGESRTNTSTAMYATKNVILDGSGNPTTQAVDYTASFVRPAGAESDNYTLDPTGTTVSNSAAVAGSYTGVITPRSLTMTFTPVTKIYDGTDTNTDKKLATLNDGAGGAVVTADGITTTSFNMTGVTSRYGSGTGASFASNVNAGSRTVEYTGLAGTLSDNNYKIVDTQYGTGTITRRRIDPTGFQVRKLDGTVANATKVYDGNDRYTLPSGAYLTTPVAPSPTTGLVTRDYGKITFDLKSGSAGHFAGDPDGNNLTSHVSEAQYVAYDVIARTSNGTTNPLSNYTFGSAAAEAAGTLKNLENITNANPAHVTASGTITPANLTATTHNITKVYDAMAEHTDGSRNIVKGDTLVTFAGWQTNDAGQQEKRTNTSTAEYLGGYSVGGKDVAYDVFTEAVRTKDVNYTAQLSGQYADDYQIVDATNTVISSAAGTGAGTTVTLNAPLTVADAGKITPRALKVKMADVSKTYDGDTSNTSATVAEITDTVNSSVIGDILGDDNVTASYLTTRYNTMMGAAPASYHSDYGRLTGTTFTPNPNASNGTPHDVQYTNMKKAFNAEFGTYSAGNYTMDADAYGKGTINRRDLNPNNFHVVDGMGAVATATKEYDGTNVYNVPSGWSIRPSGGPGTGVVAGDNVTFSLTSAGAKFTTAAKNPTANAFEATNVMYNVQAGGDPVKIRNYTLGGQKLESGSGKVYGDGTITRRTIDLALVQDTGIDKVYDGQTGLIDTASKHWNALTKTDARGNVKYAAGSKELVNDGSSFHIESNYRNSGNTSNDKNVAKTAGAVVDKDIQYDIHIAGTGDARNYAFANGTSTPTNAENGLKLSATGKITPKDLSGAFTKITKVYDGTKNVDPTAVGFTSGAVLSGDSVSLAGHAEAFQSPNVRGDGTTTVIDGAVQKNWINYSGLSLGGADADNYTISATAKGLGEITPLQLNPSTVTLLTTGPATKVYDGTRTVKWTNGSAAVNDVKNYITDAQVTVGGNTLSVLGDVSLQSAEYDTKNVAGGASVGRVTYHMRYTGTSGNFALAPGASTFDALGDGTITPKDVKAAIQGPMTKVYDGTTDVIGAARNSLGTIRTANDMVSLTGLIAGDGATNQSTAAYDDKNVGAGNKSITYDVKLDSMNAGNYRIVDAASAPITAPITTTNNTITPRRVNVTFANVNKSYDGTPTNTTIDPSVSAADAAVLNRDSAGLVNGSNKLTNLGGIVSNYGRRTGGTFTPDANAGTNKDVQYAGLAAAMGTTLGGDAGNYEFDTDGYGKGTITKANINTSDITFATTGAHKVYDGTRKVKYNGSSAKADVKNYITTATANLGGGHTADLRGDLEIDEAGTHYSSPNATNGTPDTVTYKFRLKSNNIEISGKNEFEMTDTGTIDRRVLTLDLAQKTGINKIYDATDKVYNTDNRHYDAFADNDAKGNVTYAASTTAENKLVRKADGTPDAMVNVEVAYADKNVARVGGVVSAQDINYTVKIDAAHGGKNYQLSDGTNPAVGAEVGLTTLKATGIITPRKLTLDFAHVRKPYDTKADNANKTVSAIGGDNSDGRRDATLAHDGITKTTFDMTNVASLYGAGTTDVSFQSNADVIAGGVDNSKDVQYKNLAGTLAAQTYAGNYEVADTSYGKGAIRKRTVTANDFKFNINNATKMYDGTRDVYWKDTVKGKSYKDMDHVKNYFSTSKLDLGGGNLVDINLNDIQLNSAKYNDERVAHAAGVDYDVTINTQNFEFSGSRNRIINHTGDKIEKRDLATKLPPHLIKEYDGEDTFTETNEIFANAMARANLTGVVDRDKNKIQLKVQGTYSSPDASVETRADAEARIPAQAGRNVHYDLTLSGDTDTLSNYKIGSVETLDANGEMKGNGSGKADIYKKTLTVSADPIDKVYDGTRTVVRPNGSTTAPHPAANKLKLNGFAKSADHFDFDQTAADKIDGLYSDPNVSRAADGTILDKDIAYSGVKAAFKNYADNHAGSAARNYRVDSDTVSGKGKITPRTITPNDIANGLTLADATKVYDGTRAVKHGGLNTPDALRNYLTSATVNINGTPIDIKNELTIRADEASTHYDTANVAGGAQPRVTYTLNYTGHNFDIADPITKTANGVITKRQVTAYAPGQLTKEYDGTTKVYDSGDPTIKTYYRGNQVTSGADIVQLEEENGDRGLLTNDGVQNISTATFEDKKAGRNKKVNYNIAVDAAHAGNYELVDQRGNVISQTSTNNNTIAPRRLDITFGDVSREYNGTSTNTDVTALVKDSDARATLRRDGVNPSGEQLILRDAANNDITLPSDYGYGRTDSAFTKNADANQTGEPPKDVQYRKLGDAMRTLLGDDADNYDFDETGYGKGRITKASVRESDFRMKFKDAVKEYDGTNAVNDARSRLDRSDSRMRLPRAEGWKPFALQDKDIADIKGTYQPTGGKRSKDASENSRGVQYEVQLSKQNFDLENGWDGKIRGDGAGKINRRAITAETLPYLTKEYDGTRGIVNAARDADGNLITQSGDGLMRFRHANDAAKRALITGDDVSNATTATYDTENVAWKDGVWNQGNGTTADVGVAYALGLSGADAANYKIVDSKGDEVTNAKGLGKITPKEIVLKADPQERWINEGLPTSYTGTPQGTNLSHNEVPEIVPSDTPLPGTIDYSSPNARLRVGHYAVNGTYHAPNGAKDGDVVSRNYRFIQDPANDTALYIGPYIPDYEYYKAMTQVSKMTPDEYAYENASLDRTNHYSRKPTAQVDPVPPAVNVMRDGKDITRSDINVLDDTVYTIVDEVFG